MRDPARPGPDTTADGLTVGQAAALVGVSVRTLHHWDTIGLVRPGGRTRAGYRVYDSADIARLHRVLVYRELGFPLAEIGRILDDPHTDARDHLRRQRHALTEQMTRLQRMVDAVDHMLEAAATGIQLTPAEQVAIFGDDWRPEWTDDAAERWGHTPQWTQYRERAAQLTADDWAQATAATNAFHTDLAAAKRSGTAPGSPEANALAERHRVLMSTYFDCTHAMQVCMGRMFTQDPGFAAHYDRLAPGLAHWFQQILAANAAAHGTDPATATWA